MGTSYKTTQVKILGNTWNITLASGQSNYVQVTKWTNNPWGRIGKQYPNFQAAAQAYKSPEMKTALLMAEMNLIQAI